MSHRDDPVQVTIFQAGEEHSFTGYSCMVDLIPDHAAGDPQAVPALVQLSVDNVLGLQEPSTTLHLTMTQSEWMYLVGRAAEQIILARAERIPQPERLPDGTPRTWHDRGLL